MPFNKIREEFLRPQVSRALALFAFAHLIALLICMIYPVILAILEYSDERWNSADVSNFQNFINDLTETFGWFLFYSLPAFIVAAGSYISRFFFSRAGFRKIVYVMTFLVIFATLKLDTGMDVLGHPTAYGTAALYVAALFIIAAQLHKRFGNPA